VKQIFETHVITMSTSISKIGPVPVRAFLSEDGWLHMEYNGKRRPFYNNPQGSEESIVAQLKNVYSSELGHTSIIMRNGSNLELILCIYRWQTEAPIDPEEDLTPAEGAEPPTFNGCRLKGVID
jgi:hypothetical protein